jgi:hypothetical protein
MVAGMDEENGGGHRENTTAKGSEGREECLIKGSLFWS